MFPSYVDPFIHPTGRVYGNTMAGPKSHSSHGTPTQQMSHRPLYHSPTPFKTPTTAHVQTYRNPSGMTPPIPRPAYHHGPYHGYAHPGAAYHGASHYGTPNYGQSPSPTKLNPLASSFSTPARPYTAHEQRPLGFGTPEAVLGGVSFKRTIPATEGRLVREYRISQSTPSMVPYQAASTAVTQNTDAYITVPRSAIKSSSASIKSHTAVCTSHESTDKSAQHSDSSKSRKKKRTRNGKHASVRGKKKNANAQNPSDTHDTASTSAPTSPLKEQSDLLSEEVTESKANTSAEKPSKTSRKSTITKTPRATIGRMPTLSVEDVFGPVPPAPVDAPLPTVKAWGGNIPKSVREPPKSAQEPPKTVEEAPEAVKEPVAPVGAPLPAVKAWGGILPNSVKEPPPRRD